MNRSKYYDYIEEKISILSYRISNRGKINLLELNIHSESFFADMVNLIFKCQLKNINADMLNTEGIDLVDVKNKIIAQVSATCTKQKIEASLSKETLSAYPNYRFIFIAIAGKADKLKNAAFSNPYKVKFTPNEDIIDIESLLKLVLYMSIDDQRAFFDFVKKELGSDFEPAKFDSNLTAIINILAKENLSGITETPDINAFEIERKIEFNDLISAQPTIEEYKIYYGKLDEKYKEFDKQGVNKSLSVLSIVKQQYVRLSDYIGTAHELFFSVIDSVAAIVTNSKNYVEIPYEELNMCVTIIVVDAFIRCKIFKNPEGYSHVATR